MSVRLFVDAGAATDGGTMPPSSMTANISGDLSSVRRPPANGRFAVAPPE